MRPRQLFTSILWKILRGEGVGHSSTVYLEVSGKSLQKFIHSCLRRVVPRNVWDPGKLSFDSGPASLAGEFDVVSGNLVFPISEVELAPNALCDFLAQNLHRILSDYAWNSQLGIQGLLVSQPPFAYFSFTAPLYFFSDWTYSTLIFHSLVKPVSTHEECHPSFPFPPTTLLTILH